MKRSVDRTHSVAVFSRVVFRRDHQTSAFTRTPVDGLDDVHHLLFVLERPVDLVVVTGAQIDHDVLVSEEEHHRARIVELVHLVEVRHFGDVHQIDHREVVHLFGEENSRLAGNWNLAVSNCIPMACA